MVKVIEGYILNEVIGEGNFGLVYRATHKEKPGLFAVKVIPNQKFQQNDKLQIYTNNEIQALKTIGVSDYIIRFYTMIKSKSNCYLVYQYCNGGTLLSLLRRQQKLQQKKALLIFRQLLQAFKVLNKYSIMHRDLKPQNIFFTSSNGNQQDNQFNQNDKKKVKLGDFGFCKGLKPDQNLAKTMLGSPIYMAPQVLKGQSYTTKADIWSLGVILFEMLYGYCPFQSRSIASLISTIDTQAVQLPNNVPVSEKTQNLIKRMLAKDYFRRIGWVQLFGLKIDENGQYIAEQPTNSATNQEKSGLTPNKNKFTSLFGSLSLGSAGIIPNSRSYSTIRDEQTERRNTMAPKQQGKAVSKKAIQQSYTSTTASGQNRGSSQPKDQKKFYSQNYMNILSTPLSLKKIQQDEMPKSKQKAKAQKTLQNENKNNSTNNGNTNNTNNNNGSNINGNSNDKQSMPISSLSIPSSPILYREERLTSIDNIDLMKEPQGYMVGTNNTNSSNISSTAVNMSNISNNGVNMGSMSSSSNLPMVEQTPFNKYRENIGMGSNLYNKFMTERNNKEGLKSSNNITSIIPTQSQSQLSEIDQKRNSLLRIHECLTKTLTKSMSILEQRYSMYKISNNANDLNSIKDILQDCYIVLKIVQEKLKYITQSIKITETSLLDMASIINYEHIQVEKFVIEIRNELIRYSMELPNIGNLQSNKYERNENINGFKEFIRTKQMGQLIDDNF